MRMGPRRRRGFTAARVALKRLARQLDLVGKNRPDRAIETLCLDGVSLVSPKVNLLFGIP